MRKDLEESGSWAEVEGWAPAAGGASGECVLRGDRVSLWEGENVLQPDGGAGCTAV